MHARIVDNIVVEKIDVDNIEGLFVPGFAASLVPCDETVQIGWVWDGESFAAPPGPTDEELAAVVRARRDRLLAESDFTQLPDAPVAPTLAAEWQVYRQALRDITEQAGFPESVTWPEGPE